MTITDVSSAKAKRARPRPTRNEWLQAGRNIVVEHGRKSLKMDVLCRRVGVARDLFYFCFGDMQEYRAAMIRSYGQLRCAEVPREKTPRGRLRSVMISLLEPELWTQERELREWARSDATVGESMRQADSDVVSVMRTAFTDSGFASFEADLRANALFASGFGFIYLSGSTPNVQAVARLDAFVDILLDR